LFNSKFVLRIHFWAIFIKSILVVAKATCY